jgi:hypothetical protein
MVKIEINRIGLITDLLEVFPEVGLGESDFIHGQEVPELLCRNTTCDESLMSVTTRNR